MAEVIGIKFNHSCKVYYFAPKNEKFEKRDGVVVETSRGTEYGVVVAENREIEDKKIIQPLKPVLRKATAEDEAKVKRNEEKVAWAVKTAREKVAARKLEMKIIDAEFAFDGSKCVLYFTAAGRVDFRELVKDLASALKSRIELRQVGIRDETRILGGLAPCGRVCCCASYLPDFKKVTIKMAKTQGLSLNPAKISGLCGRLMCCLEFENEHYSETFKLMPKTGSTVGTPDGKGTVVAINMLKMLVTVKTEEKDGDFTYKTYDLKDIKVKKANKIEELDNSADDKEIKSLED